MTKKIKLLLLFPIFPFLCCSQEKYSVFLTDTTKCEYFYTDDNSDSIFDNILVKNYVDKVSVYQHKLDTINNSYDTLQIWIMNTLSINSNFLKYCILKGYTAIVEFKITSNDFGILNKIWIGMSKKSFQKLFFNKYFKTKLNRQLNCIEISDFAGFVYLRFVFKNNYLVLVEYYDNTF